MRSNGKAMVVLLAAVLTMLIIATASSAGGPAMDGHGATSEVIAAPAGISRTEMPGQPPSQGAEAVREQFTSHAPPVPDGHNSFQERNTRNRPSGVGLVMLVPAAGAMWLFFWSGWHRLEHGPQRPQVFTPLFGFALLVVFVVLGLAGTALALHQLGLSPGPMERPLTLAETVLLGLGRYSAEGVALVVYIVLVVHSRQLVHDRRPSPVLAAIIGGGALLLFWPLALFISWLASVMVLLMSGQPPDLIGHQTLVMLLAADRDVWFFALIAMVLVAAPVLEEVFYRGIVQETLVRAGAGRWTAIIVTSALFALMHYSAAPEPLALPGLLASLFALSLGFGWVYEKTGRLAAPIAMHVLFNSGNLALAFVV